VRTRYREARDAVAAQGPIVTGSRGQVKAIKIERTLSTCFERVRKALTLFLADIAQSDDFS
jgi:hypothetical protein